MLAFQKHMRNITDKGTTLPLSGASKYLNLLNNKIIPIIIVEFFLDNLK